MDEIGAEATLAAESGGLLKIGCVSALEAQSARATVSVRSDWYSAEVPFETSIDRVRDFLESLRSVLATGIGACGFINDDGNFDLRVEMSRNGHVSVSGVLSKNMFDDLQLKFGLRTDRYSLEVFERALRKITGDALAIGS